jgi:hypothetical protein
MSCAASPRKLSRSFGTESAVVLTRGRRADKIARKYIKAFGIATQCGMYWQQALVTIPRAMRWR